MLPLLVGLFSGRRQTDSRIRLLLPSLFCTVLAIDEALRIVLDDVNAKIMIVCYMLAMCLASSSYYRIRYARTNWWE
jgi:hypothetical protein